jgi:hypothetical protein
MPLPVQSFERSLAWLGRYRRLSEDYEFEAMIDLASIRLMLNRIARAWNSSDTLLSPPGPDPGPGHRL